MKKFILTLVVIIFTIAFSNVYAMDSVFSLNKYDEEKFDFIKKSYNSNGNFDGYVVGGIFLKEKITNDDTNYDDNQLILVKYRKNGDVSWKFTYGKNKSDNMECLEYSYDEDGNIDGYILVSEKTYDVALTSETDNKDNSIVLKIGLDGKLVFEKEIGVEDVTKIKKIIPTYRDDGNFDGYIGVGSITHDDKTDSCVIVKYDRNFNIIWSKIDKKEDKKDVSYYDVVNIYKDYKVLGYSVICQYTDSNNKIHYSLIHFDLDGSITNENSDTLNDYSNLHLSYSNDGYILYGCTSEVKIKKGNYSYFMISYDSQDEVLWETVGDNSINHNKIIRLFPLTSKYEVKEYLFLYINNDDSSIEVVRVDLEGNIKEKIKKIKNDYYNISDFQFSKGTMYFVGQINCPEDDNCEYDSNSLFLISDEDKVIEVKDDDSMNIIVIFLVIIVVCGVIVFFRNYKNKQKEAN